MLGLHPQTLRNYLNQAKSPAIATPPGSASTMLQPIYTVSRLPNSSATAESVPPSGVATSTDRSPRCDNSTPTPRLSPTSPVDSTGNAKDCSPYWNDCIAGISSMLWLPSGTGWPGSALNSSSGWSSRTAAQSWFSTSQMPAPSRSSPRIYSPSSIRSAARCTGSDVTERQSRRIRVYPDQQQKAIIGTWLEASRWVYNLAVEVLQPGLCTFQAA